MSAVNVEDCIKSVPRKDRHKLDMVVDFEEEDEDGYLIEEHLYKISLVMDSWEGEVAKQLELGRKTRTEIKKKHGSLDDQKLAALREWRQGFGDEATYRKLIECFFEADKPDWAEAVCDLFRDDDAAPPPSTGPTMLGEKNHGEVRDLLWSTRSQYTNLGYALNIPAGTMTSIPKENFYQVEACYNAVLMEVLKRGVTQEELAQALESKQLKYEQLAVEVRDHTFKTSSPPKKVQPAPRRTRPEDGKPPKRVSKGTSRKGKPSSPSTNSSSARDSASPSETTDDPSIDFSESLGPDDLAKWLLQRFGPGYNKEIDKLKSQGINGELFLQLPSIPDLMKEVGLIIGFKHLILKEIAVLSSSPKPKDNKVGSSTTPIHSDREPVLPNSSLKPKEDEVNSSSTAPSKDNFNSSSAAIASDDECVSDNNMVCAILANISDVSESSGEVDADTRSAFVPKDVAWFGCTELVVKVMKEIPPGWTYHGDPLNIGNIMSWANEWRGDNIPEFRLARPGEPAEVRVEFNNRGIRCSYIGTRAQSRLNIEPTMWLDLHTGGVTDAYKKHIVVHEFGHILGLTHEHQRSDFWKHVRSYIDTDKMKKDLKISDADFRHDWEADNWEVGEVATDYDPSSVMHYWFKPSWLTEGYSKLSNIAKDKSKGKLSLSAAKILTGIHHFCKHPVDKPSKLDIHLLSVVYYQQSNAPVDEESQKTQELNFPVMSTPDSSNKEAKETSNTLAFYYKSGEMPFDKAVSSLNGLKEGGLSWHPIQRDNEKAMFRVNKAFDVILTSQSECIEVQVSKVGHGAQLLPEVCISVRETLEKKLRSLNDGKQIYELTFKCTCDQYRCINKQSESPPKQRLMKVLESNTGPPTTAECLCISLDQELSKESHLIWFAPRFKDFHDQKNGKLTIFENDLSFFLSKDGKELVKINPEIDEKVKVDLSRAYVRDRRQHGAPSEKVIRTSLPFPNISDEELKEVWSFTTTYEKGVEHSKMEFKKLSINAELAPCIEVMETGGSIGSVGVGYEKGTEITHAVHEIKSEEVVFNREVRIRPKSTVIAKLVTITRSFECQVERIDVSFNPKSKVKCTVRKKNDTEKKAEYELQEFLRLGGDPIPDRSGTIHRSISVKYEWKEASDEIRYCDV